MQPKYIIVTLYSILKMLCTPFLIRTQLHAYKCTHTHRCMHMHTHVDNNTNI